MPYTKENLAEYLEKSNRDYYGKRTWANMFGNVDLSKQLALDNLKTDFGKVAGEAFDVAQKNAAAIGSSNLISGHKDASMEANQLALQEAYDSYMANYHTGAQTIEENTAKQMSDVNQRLMQQAEMYSKYYGEHFNYLQSLWDKYEAGEIAGDFFKSNESMDYLQNIYDETGEAMQGLKSIGDIESMIYDIDNEGNKTLNPTGVKFFDQLENSQLLKEYSFENYLRENNAELLDWAMSEDPYNWAPNRLGESTMAGTFRQMTGRESDDEIFTSVENVSGMSAESFNKILVNAENKLVDLNTALDNNENIQNATHDYVKAISDIVNSLNIESDLLKDVNSQGGSYESIEEYITDIVEGYSNNRESTDTIGTIVSSGVGMGAFGAMFGSIVPGIGTALGGLIGGLIGTFGGGATAATNDENAKKINEENRNKVKQDLKNITALLVNYSNEKRASIQKNFYNSETSSGGEISSNSPMISRHSTDQYSYYNYGLNNGGKISYLSSSKLKKGLGSGPIALSNNSNVRDKENDNFSVDFGGFTYQLEVGDKTLDKTVLQELYTFMENSVGKKPSTGDMFMYEGRLWVTTEDGTIRSVKNRFLNSDYSSLLNIMTKQYG